MYGNYQNIRMPSSSPSFIPSESTPTPSNFTQYDLVGRNDYYNDLLVKNIGKRATFYLSYSDSLEWRDKVFEGIIEEAGKDYVLIKSMDRNEWFLLLLVYLGYVSFDEKLTY